MDYYDVVDDWQDSGEFNRWSLRNYISEEMVSIYHIGEDYSWVRKSPEEIAEMMRAAGARQAWMMEGFCWCLPVFYFLQLVITEEDEVLPCLQYLMGIFGSYIESAILINLILLLVQLKHGALNGWITPFDSFTYDEIDEILETSTCINTLYISYSRAIDDRSKTIIHIDDHCICLRGSCVCKASSVEFVRILKLLGPRVFVGGFLSMLSFKDKPSTPRRKSESSPPTTPPDRELEQQANKGATRETYKFDSPTQELGMSELLKTHNSGDRFLYAAVTSVSQEEDESRLRRLIKHQPKLSRQTIPVNEVPPLYLYSLNETFKLSQLLPKRKQGEKKKTFIHISDVIILYGSVISTDHSFSKLHVTLLDNRLLGNKVAKSYIANTNVISKASMSLSYSFPRDEIDDISLCLSCETSFLEEGRMWGTAQVVLQVQETLFPVQFTNAGVQAINAIPQGMLEERIVNPDSIDISIMNNDKNLLRELFMQGDLADETAPVVNRTKKISYAKSSLNGPKGTVNSLPATEGWEHVAKSRVQQANAEEMSQDDFENDSVDEALIDAERNSRITQLRESGLNKLREIELGEAPASERGINKEPPKRPTPAKSAMKQSSNVEEASNRVARFEEPRKVEVLDRNEEYVFRG